MSDESETRDTPEVTPETEAEMPVQAESASEAEPSVAPAGETEEQLPLDLGTPIAEEAPAEPAAAPETDAAPAPPLPAPEPEGVTVSYAGGFAVALGFLTRLPFGPEAAPVTGALGRAMGWFPLVGVIVGGIGGAVYAASHLLLPPSVAALLALAATALVTGALHEDGLADVADGFGGGADRTAKLAIMRDSRIGSFGAIALVLSLALRAVALAEIGTATNDYGGALTVAGALVAAHALARAAIPVAMQALIPARRDGLAVAAGQPGAAQTGIAVTLAVLVTALALSPPGAALAALAGATIGTVAMVALAHAQIGGHTGDVLGAVEQTAETLALLGVLAAL